MAKATAMCKCDKCGSEFVATATKYSRKEADSWEAWARDNYTTCSDCYQKEREEKKQAEAAAQAEQLNGFGLKPLTGSEKQVAWATDIRSKFITRCLTGYPEAISSIKAMSGEKTSELLSASDDELGYYRWAKGLVLALRETAAKWFIDNRNALL